MCTFRSPSTELCFSCSTYLSFTSSLLSLQGCRITRYTCSAVKGKEHWAGHGWWWWWFCLPVVSASLWPRGLQHARPPCLTPSPEVCPSSCSLHRWWVVVLSAFSSSWFCSSSTPYLKGNTKHGPLFIHLEIPFSSSLSFQKFIWIIYKRRRE